MYVGVLYIYTQIPSTFYLIILSYQICLKRFTSQKDYPDVKSQLFTPACSL